MTSGKADERIHGGASEADDGMACAGGSVERTDSTFLSDNGSLGHPRVPTRVYTVGLHRPNPVALEKPGFIGFFAPQGSLAEREGLPRRPQKPNKLRHFLRARWRRVYQSCAPKSTGFSLDQPPENDSRFGASIC
jgi:hypothetical protein